MYDSPPYDSPPTTTISSTPDIVKVFQNFFTYFTLLHVNITRHTIEIHISMISKFSWPLHTRSASWKIILDLTKNENLTWQEQKRRSLGLQMAALFIIPFFFLMRRDVIIEMKIWRRERLYVSPPCTSCPHMTLK